MFTTIISLIGTALFATLGWVLRKLEKLDTRVAVLEALQSPLMTLINSRFDNTDQRLDRMDQRLDRIESQTFDYKENN